MIARVFALLVLIAGVAAFAAWYDYQRFLEAPLPFAEGTVYEVKKGTTAKAIGHDLQQQGLLTKSHWQHWFYLYSRLSKKGTAIKTGEFELASALTPPAFLDVLVTGRSRQYTDSIIEGTTFKEVLLRLAQSQSLVQTLNGVDASEVMVQLGYPGDHPEGRFFADTYNFPKDTSDLQFLRRAMKQLDKVLEEEWQGREPDLPFNTPYEALILASIVEKETAVAAERPLIAGVFVSRLRKRMRLQTDPTVIYGMGDSYDGNIRRKDLRTDTPYNTYTRGGLPPTPIAMVGRESIHAVMHPDKTTALYFVSRGDGTHKFSETIDEHNAAVRKYQLRRRNP